MAPEALEEPVEEPVPGGRRSSPSRAAVLSLVPGAGQLYTRQPRKAAVFLVTTVAALAAAVTLVTRGEGMGVSMLGRHQPVLFLLLAFGSIIAFLLLLLLGLYLWASSAVDARESAMARNAGRDPTGRWWLFHL